MNANNSVEQLALRKLRHSINGNPKKLRKLVDSTRKMDLDIDVQNFVDNLEYSLDNDTPFFKHIRSKFPYNENANLRRPCMIIDNPDILREAVNEYLVPHGHEHSEDLIKDRETVEWIDRYAERYRELVDPIWEQIINNPSSRWYRHGYRYKRLFRFQGEESDSSTSDERTTQKQSAETPLATPAG